MIKYTTGFVDKLEDILSESGYRVRYERGNFQSGWCLLDHKSVVVLNKFLNTEGRVNTLVDLIPQLKIDFDKLTLSSQKIYDFLTDNHLKKAAENNPAASLEDTEAPLGKADEPNGQADAEAGSAEDDQHANESTDAAKEDLTEDLPDDSKDSI